MTANNYQEVVTLLLQCIITHSIIMTSVGYRSPFELTKDSPYLSLTGELLCLCEYLGEKMSVLYIVRSFNCIDPVTGMLQAHHRVDKHIEAEMK